MKIDPEYWRSQCLGVSMGVYFNRGINIRIIKTNIPNSIFFPQLNSNNLNGMENWSFVLASVSNECFKQSINGQSNCFEVQLVYRVKFICSKLNITEKMNNAVFIDQQTLH